jgi:hypothetical protein
MVREAGGVQGPFGKILILIFSARRAGSGGDRGAVLEVGLAFDVTETEDSDRWGARLEIYESDPAQEPSGWRASCLRGVFVTSRSRAGR